MMSDSTSDERNPNIVDSEALYPLALLMDELKHDDIANRVEAMKKLDSIALALGPERTRDELVSFLTDVAQDDEDEVFAVLADELGKFVPLVGGPEYATVLLPVLDLLASTEETLVRDKAVKSLNTIAAQMSPEQLLESFIPLVEQLANADWFSSKVSACGLFQSVIVAVKDSTIRKKLLLLYSKLVLDETPMVRRAAGKHLPKLIDLLAANSHLCNDEDWECISGMFQKIINDNQDSVKFLAVDILISTLKYFNQIGSDVHTKDLLESAIKLITDEAWRVRYMAAERYATIAEQFGQNKEYINSLIPPFLSLCQDNESDVKKAIAEQLPGFTKYISDSNVIIDDILPAVRNLSTDESETVRASLALKITDLVLLLNKDEVIQHLLPILLNMLKDEFPNVRLNIIANLKNVNEVIGIDMLSESLLPAITELAKDVNWRVRIAIIEYTPVLAEQLGVQFFDQQLSDLFLSWLWDTVHAIRQAAVQNLTKLTVIFGSDWCRDEIIARLLKFDSQLLENFVYRFTMLSALTALVEVVDVSVVVDQVLPFVVGLADDKVPNIRFNVAKSYAKISDILVKANKTQLIKETIIPSLEKLCQDEDFDVRYFAGIALQGIKSLLN